MQCAEVISRSSRLQDSERTHVQKPTIPHMKANTQLSYTLNEIVAQVPGF